MSEHADREHFIPIRVSDLVQFLCEEHGPQCDQKLTSEQQQQFRQFADAAASHIHAVYLEQLKRLKEAYAPFDPDADTRSLQSLSAAERVIRLQELFADMVQLLERANYTRLSRDAIAGIAAGASGWGVDMEINWDCFDQFELFIRGKGNGKRTRRKWYRWFRTEQVSVPTFQRIAMMLKQKPHKYLGADADTQNVFMKLFKDIPQMDVEMLFPGTRLKMPMLERLKLGGSTLSSVGYVIWKLQTFSIGILTGIFTGAIGLATVIALYTPLALLIGYGYKTYSYFQVTKQTYQLQLTQSLYYQNLDNNAGVLYRLLDEAEEQEIREVLLAYFYLWRYAGDHGWTAAELDDYIELDLERRLNLSVDFEIADALRKLSLAGIVTETAGRYRVLPIAEAQDRLDDIWEKYAHTHRLSPPAKAPTPATVGTPPEPQ
ncbi:MAG: DUF3754 domain-containing protein [Bacteroidales bacterium]|nr:DUF3754 domain-containing protein [Bacteroidales bacterium]